MSQARLRPMELTGPSYIISKKPDLWLDAGRGIGTTGSRLFSAANQECFTLTSDLAPTTQDFWFSGWIKPVSTAYCPIWVNGATNNGRNGFYIYTYLGRLEAYLNDNVQATLAGSTVSAANSIVSAVWTHIVLTFDRNSVCTCYINGVAQTANTLDISGHQATLSPSYFAATSIGSDQSSSTGYFNGSLSRLTYGQGVLPTTAEIAELYNQGNGKYFAELSAGLSAKVTHYWNLNESSGPAYDAKGTNDGVVTCGELVANGGFETVTGNDFVSWLEDATAPSTITDGGAEADSGSHCLCITTDASNASCYIYQSILIVGKTYVASIRAKGTTGKQIRISVNPAYDFLCDLTTAYQLFTTPPFIATGTELYISKHSASNVAYIDTVSCKESTATAILSSQGPRETIAADSFGGYNGTLVGFTDPVTPWSTDTPNGSYTSNKLDSVGSATGVMTGFADIDLAHVDGPNGAWGPFVPNLGSGQPVHGNAWIVSSIKDTRSDSIPDSINTRCWDEYYSEPASSGSRWFDGSSTCFAMTNSPVYGSGNLTLESWIYPTTFTAKRTIFGTGGMGDELISNGGFETLGAGTPDVFANWTETFGLESTITDGGADSDSGSRCAKLLALNSTVSISQAILTVGRVYILTFRCKSVTNSTILLTSSTPSTSYSTTTSYQTFSTTFTSNSTSLRFSTPTDTNQTYYLDNVSCKEVVPGVELSLEPTTGSLTSFIANNAVQITTSGMPPTTAYTWHHTAAVINRTQQRVDLWLNGALCASGSLSSLTGLINPSGTCRAIGAYDTERAVNPFAGAIARARISIGYAYTNADIAETYNGGSGRDYNDLSTALKAKVTHNWALNEASGTAIDSKGGNNAVVSSGTISSAASVYLPSYDGQLTGFAVSPRSSTDVPTPLLGKCKSSTFSSGKYINTAVNTLSGLGARSISLWFKLASAPSAVETLMAEADQNLAQYGINISIAAAGGLVNVVVYKGGGATAIHPILISATSVCDNSWHHIVYTWDGTLSTNKAILYIDGAVSDSDTTIVTTQGAASTYPLNISGNNSGTLCTNGKVCRPQIWAGRAITQAEVSTLYVGGDVTEGLTVEYRFMESDSITVPFTHSMDFDGANSKVDVGHQIIGSGTAPITLSSWIYADGVGETAGRIVDNGTTQLYLSSTTALTYTSDGGTLAANNEGFSTGSWKHVAITRDSVGHAKFFVDGKHINRTSLITINSGPPTSGTTNLFIGNRNATDRTFDGKIGKVEVYNSVLTQAQIRTLSQGGSVGTPLGGWKFDTPMALPYLAGSKAIRFDGVNDYISLANINDSEIVLRDGNTLLLNDGKTLLVNTFIAAFTIAGWVKPNDFSIASIFVGNTIDTNNDGIQIDTTGKISITVGGVNTVLSTVGLYTTIWQHIAVTRALTTNVLKVYINGVDVTNGILTQAGTLDITSIGATNSTPMNFANSSIADVLIYNLELTQSQIRNIIDGSDYTSGLIARWKLGEVPRSVASCAGGYSLEFDGSDDHVALTNQDLTVAFTISGWVKPHNFAIAQTIIGDTADANSDGIHIDATTGKISITVGGTNTVLSTTGLTIGQWQHIAVSRAVTTNALLVYIDGVNKTTGSPIQSGTLGIKDIGATHSTPAKFMDGNIDDVRVYSSALSSADILLLSQGGSPTTVPVSNWTFDDGPQYGEPSDGDPISVWESRDSHKYVFTQPTASLRPTYLQSGKNGKPGLRFNGTSQFLERPGHLLGDTEGDVIIVSTPSGTLSNDSMYSQSDRYTNNSLEFRTFNGRDAILASGVSGGFGSTILTPARTYVQKFTSDSLKNYISLDGVAETVTASGAGNVGTWFGDVVVGSGSLTSIGNTTRTGFAGNFWEGDIYEIIAVNQEKTKPSQVTKMVTTTKKKYGIQ